MVVYNIFKEDKLGTTLQHIVEAQQEVLTANPDIFQLPKNLRCYCFICRQEVRNLTNPDKL